MLLELTSDDVSTERGSCGQWITSAFVEDATGAAWWEHVQWYDYDRDEAVAGFVDHCARRGFYAWNDDDEDGAA